MLGNSEDYPISRALLDRMRVVCEQVKEFAVEQQGKANKILKEHDIPEKGLPIYLGETNIFEEILKCRSGKESVVAFCLSLQHLLHAIEVLGSKPSETHDMVLQLLLDFSRKLRDHGSPFPDHPETTEILRRKLDKLVQIFVENPEFLDFFGQHPPERLVTAVRDYELSREINISLHDLSSFISHQ